MNTKFGDPTVPGLLQTELHHELPVHRVDGADDGDITFLLLFFIQFRFLMLGNGFQLKITVHLYPKN